MTNKEKYYSFCEQINYVPIFYRPAWWEQLSEKWEVLHFAQYGTDYFMPYLLEKKMGFSFIRNPHLTPYSGLFYELERNIPQPELTDAFNCVMNLLPSSSEIEIDSYPSAFPLTEDSFRKVTHLLELSSKEGIYDSFKSSLKRQIKKAQKTLTSESSNDLSILLELHSSSMNRQGTTPTFDTTTAKRLFNYSITNQSGKLYYAKDKEGNTHAGLWVVLDSKKMYYLLGGSNPDFLGSGAMGFLLWTAIQDALKLELEIFDFEGSNVPSIARFFKGFGAEETYFPVIRKEPNKLLATLKKIKKA